jgi:hypothetical protein
MKNITEKYDIGSEHTIIHIRGYLDLYYDNLKIWIKMMKVCCSIWARDNTNKTTPSILNYKSLWLFWYIHFAMYLDIIYVYIYNKIDEPKKKK